LRTIPLFSALIGLSSCAPPEPEPAQLPRSDADASLQSISADLRPARVDRLGARKLLEEQLSHAPTNLHGIERDDGVQYVRVVNGFQHATMVVRTADGALEQHCVDDARAALRLLDQAVR
jgi:hypothetical protein